MTAAHFAHFSAKNQNFSMASFHVKVSEMDRKVRKVRNHLVKRRRAGATASNIVLHPPPLR